MTSTLHPALPGCAATGAFDEAVEPDGAVRPVCRSVLDAVAGHDLRALRALVHQETRAAGMRFVADGGSATS